MLSLASLIAAFRTANTALNRDINAPSTKEACNRAYNALPPLCNYIFGTNDNQGLIHGQTTDETQLLLNHLLPGGPVLSVMLAMNTSLEYVFSMHNEFVPLVSTFKVRVSRSANSSKEVVLNMLEFYLLHFAYAARRNPTSIHSNHPCNHPVGRVPMSPLKRRMSSFILSAQQSLLGRSLNDRDPNQLNMYNLLLQHYLHYFIPLSTDQLSVFSINQYRPSPLNVSQVYADTSMNFFGEWPAMYTSTPAWRSGHLRLTCSQFFIASIAECWLGRDLYMAVKDSDKLGFQPMVQAILKGLMVLTDHISCPRLLSVLALNLHTSIAQSPRSNQFGHEEHDIEYLTSSALRFAFEYITPALYRFLTVSLTTIPVIWRNDGQLSLQEIIPIWIRILNPLNLKPASSENNLIPRIHKDDIDVVDLDQYLIQTFSFYTTLTHHYIDRVMKDLCPAHCRAQSDPAGSDYTCELRTLCTFLQVFGTKNEQPGPGPGQPTVYLTRIARMEHVLLHTTRMSPLKTPGSPNRWIDTNMTDQSILRASLDMYIAKLESTVLAPLTTSVADLAVGSIPVNVSRDRWHAITTDTSALRRLALASIQGYNTRQIILQPYSAPVSSPKSPVKREMTTRMLSMTPLRLLSVTNALMPAGMRYEAVNNEARQMLEVCQLACGAARVQQVEWHVLMQEASDQVHAYTMHVAHRASKGLKLQIPTNSFMTKDQPDLLSRSLSDRYSASEWLVCRVQQTMDMCWTWTLQVIKRVVPETWIPHPLNESEVYVTAMCADGVLLLDLGRAQVGQGTRLCLPMPSLPASALPRHMYLATEIPVLVELAYWVEDCIRQPLAYMYTVGLAQLDQVKSVLLRASGGGMLALVGQVHSGISLRCFGNKHVLVWILLARLLVVIKYLQWYPSVLLYSSLIVGVMTYPFSSTGPAQHQIPKIAAVLAGAGVATACVDHGLVENGLMVVGLVLALVGLSLNQSSGVWNHGDQVCVASGFNPGGNHN